MKSTTHEYLSGFRQGLRERGGPVLRACPYRQWPLSQLRRYQAWVRGWFRGRQVPASPETETAR